MRLWSLHPEHLDAKGLVALWREGLLALNVLQGKTTGYRNHPQLERFKAHPDPVAAITSYLHTVCDEADRRGYQFKRDKLPPRTEVARIPITTGQLRYEEEHLRAKLAKRSPEDLAKLKDVKHHPLLEPTPGEVASWEHP